MSDQIEDKSKDTVSEDAAAAAYDRLFRKYRQLILLLLIAAVLFVIGFLVYGAAKSARGGAGQVKTDDKISALDARIKPDLTIELAPGVGMELVKVKAGSFTMSRFDKANWKDETEHEVTLKNDFYLGVTEVTQEQWRAVTGGDPSSFKGGRRPVEMVSWNDAMEFCEKLNRGGKAPQGWKFTLPTETQWEFAARGGIRGRNCKYSGSDELKEVGWYGDSDADAAGGIKGATRFVAAKRANELGLYDMSGNVWEWCLDDYVRESDKVLPESRLTVSASVDGKTVLSQ